MRKEYLDLMEKTLAAYSDEHIFHYFDKVQKEGLTEHGFPRLTSNIGILIAKGRRSDLLPIFLEMMEYCCKMIPKVQAANDFSVREMLSCINELEKSNVVPHNDIARWKSYLAEIVPTECYSVYASTPTEKPNNWALFTCVSEYFRQSKGLCQSDAFIDMQLASQLQRFDENGMYKDNEADIYHPMAYDLVSRTLLSLLLYAGYQGRYFERIDGILRTAGLFTLNMQSATGEMAFGGRSNQFLHNEACLAAIFEYEAKRYQKEGNACLAGRFKAAAFSAGQVISTWLSKNPISHIKNRFSPEMNFGCETYGYFDKYMITTASFIYVAYLFCEENIPPIKAEEATVWSTSKHFHKTFVKCGGYSLEFDTNADPNYDANGLGRIHKQGAPGAICLSLPFAQSPNYRTGEYNNKSNFSICPAIKTSQGEWRYAAENGVAYRASFEKAQGDTAQVAFQCIFADGIETAFECTIDKDGVLVCVKGETAQEVGICLPIFTFDGEKEVKIDRKEGKLIVEYDGWICEYQAEDMRYLNADVANRNGIYKCYLARGLGKTAVRIKIYQDE
ncbi:MAG: hypothetical protein J6S04_03810 [Clostridia bacterium]|nr:hypothetical protein [Clostridia bacterium]